jgi:hypothetical protein
MNLRHRIGASLALVMMVAVVMVERSQAQSLFAGYDMFCGLPVVIGYDPQGASARLDNVGRPYIHLDPGVAANWTVSRMFALAHECAHHRLGHTSYLGALQRFSGGTARQELEADCWAANALRRVGYEFDINRTVLEQAHQGHFSFNGYPSGSQRAAEILRCANGESSDEDIDPFENIHDDGEVWISDVDLNWNRNPASPIVRYMIEVTNDDSSRARCSIRVNQVLISRASSEPVRVHRSQVYPLNIPSGEVRTIRDSMRWYGDAEVYPAIRWQLQCR